MKSKVENYIYFFLSILFLIILLPKPIQMIIIGIIFLLLMVNYKKIYIEKKVLPMFCFACVHVLSIMFNSLNCDSFTRILAAFNTVMIWFLGIFFYSYISKMNINKKIVNKIMFGNLVIFSALGLLVFILKIIGNDFSDPILSKLITTDWANGIKSVRFTCAMEYPNLAVLFYFLCFPFAYEHIKEKNFLKKLIFLIISIIPVIAVNSRMGIILVILNFISLIPKIAIKKKTRNLLFFLIILISLFVCFLKGDYLLDRVIQLINSRGDSTSMRSSIYLNSIEKALNQSPFIGCGIKNMYMGYPLGSHSTYIGVFYKTGFLGLLIFFIGYYNLLITYLKNIDTNIQKIHLISFLFLSIMLAVEDIDGANWIGILFFVLNSVYFNSLHKNYFLNDQKDKEGE